MYEMYRKGVSSELEGEPDIKVERYPMWHGTTEERVTQIVHEKFDRGKAGTNGMITSNDVFINNIIM